MIKAGVVVLSLSLIFACFSLRLNFSKNSGFFQPLAAKGCLKSKLHILGYGTVKLSLFHNYDNPLKFGVEMTNIEDSPTALYFARPTTAFSLSKISTQLKSAFCKNCLHLSMLLLENSRRRSNEMILCFTEVQL